LEEEIEAQKDGLNTAVFDMYGIGEENREEIQNYLEDFPTVIE